jgi:hypothetical protein
MQILLTQREFDDLNEKAKRGENLPSKARLMTLCRTVANAMSVDLHPSAEPEPWGCILDRARYCDRCPVQDICPHEGKEFSQ